MSQLQEYWDKRSFEKTPEPRGEVQPSSRVDGGIFVVQEHHARRLHYDFRLEMDGVLRSWSVPKGPSLKPGERRLAVNTEDHPLAYADFEGDIPKGEYGGGHMEIWDRGQWQCSEDPIAAYNKGRIKFSLNGQRLSGNWTLVKTSDRHWLLIKSRDNSLTQEEKPAATTQELPYPELATLAEAPPTGPDWLHELKWDGYRLLAIKDGKSVKWLTRQHNDWSHLFPNLTREIQKLPVDKVWLDGEVVSINEQGHSDFQQLQNIVQTRNDSALSYYIFDLLQIEGQDLRELPLEIRKTFLEELLQNAPSQSVRYSDHVVGRATEIFEAACAAQEEGLVSKHAASTYQGKRSSLWVKSKCQSRQEFVVVGYTPGQGSRQGFGALLLAVREDSKLRYVGKVGTGFNGQSLNQIRKELEQRHIDESAVDIDVPRMTHVQWVEPELVAEVAFTGWTGDGRIRHGSFQGLRWDKPSGQVVAETVRSSATPAFITHPDRILFSQMGLTKQELGRYYQDVSAWMLPHIERRPLTLVRCPRGQNNSCFYQKNIRDKGAPGVRTAPVVSIDNLEGLWGLVQLGTLEIHTWNCRREAIETPDQVVFDLDPDVGLEWSMVIDAAHELRHLLELLQLKAYIKTTGGKGLHLVVPIIPKYTWREVKDFAKAMAKELESRAPKRYVAQMAKAKRKGRIFIDYLRNAEGATAVAPFSTRAREGAPVATPLLWDEVKESLNPQRFSPDNVRERLQNTEEVWEGFFAHQQKIQLLESSPIVKRSTLLT